MTEEECKRRVWFKSATAIWDAARAALGEQVPVGIYGDWMIDNAQNIPGVDPLEAEQYGEVVLEITKGGHHYPW